MNQKSIKDRIASINSTRKITRAMKMVAAAKVKKCENAVKASRPFTKEMNEMLYKLLDAVDIQADEEKKPEKPSQNWRVLLEKRTTKNVGLLVISSDKGLAGAYNANVVRYAVKEINKYAALGIGAKVFVVGQKGLNVLKREQRNINFEIVKTYPAFIEGGSAALGTVIGEDMSTSFVNGEIDEMKIITTRFRNMMSYSVEEWEILPMTQKPQDVESLSKEMDFEPSLPVMLHYLVPFYIANIIYQALLEATASELASRMTAMSAACNNADEMIRTLTVDYNKARQCAITQEITEVVSGADALS
ncbi:MAG: ATP synthase F1 subunit gamma [Candidatus Gastranaerophilales bacterium]|nr:ATP synthase F1 subunit gamma [Candidatus Gastranaerophilales bacterium]